MKRTLLLAFALFLLFCADAFSQSIGVSTFPLEQNKGLVTTEFVNYAASNDQGGPGFQARYTRKLNSAVTIDGGLAFADSAYNKRFFVASDIEILPDYGNQPRVSVRPFIQRAQEFKNYKNIIGAAPVVTKGFNTWGKEVYPYAALPMSLVLISGSQKYETRTVLALGAAAKSPFKEFENVIFSAEGDINISHGYSAIFIGMTLPMM
jgi:hypothetical protein